jgi:hypothetical protein
MAAIPEETAQANPSVTGIKIMTTVPKRLTVLQVEIIFFAYKTV